MNENDTIGKVIKYSKEIEGILENKYGAVGKGLHEKVSSVESNLDESIVKKIRYIASVRNHVVHEYDYVLSEPSKYYRTCEMVIEHLNKVEVSRKNEEVLSEGLVSVLKAELIVIVIGMAIGFIIGIALFPLVVRISESSYSFVEYVLWIMMGGVGWVIGSPIIFSYFGFEDDDFGDDSGIIFRTIKWLNSSTIHLKIVGSSSRLFRTRLQFLDDSSIPIISTVLFCLLIVIGLIIGFLEGISEGGIGRGIVYGLLWAVVLLIGAFLLIIVSAVGLVLSLITILFGYIGLFFYTFW